MADLAILRLDDREVRKWVDRLGAQLKDLTPLLRTLYALVGMKDIIRHFRDQRGPDGPWKKRAPFTQELYEAIRRGAAQPAPGVHRGAYSPANKLLVLTGNMRGSLQPYFTRVLNTRSIIVWANAPYSGQHDQGKATWPKIPARPFMWLSRDAQSRMTREIWPRLLRGG